MLEPHFTNLDRPVFCLVNLPETVKGALFARYSRYPGTLRRLFCEEFADDLPAAGRPFDGVEGERAAGLYERVFIGYGDDSIAQVGGAHVACEWVSNVLTKILQRGRLAAYLEQSTRYIPYDQPGRGDRRLPLLLGRRARARATRRRWTSSSRSTRAASRRSRPGPPSAGRAIPSSPSAPGGLDPGQGARPAARAAARLDPEPRRHLRLGPGLRAAAAAPRRLAAAGGARLRRDAAHRAPARDPELRRPGRPPRPRRRLGRAPARAPRGDRARGRAARPRPPRRRPGALGRAGPRRRHRGRPAGRLALRVGGRRRGPRSAAGSPPSTRSSAPS